MNFWGIIYIGQISVKNSGNVRRSTVTRNHTEEEDVLDHHTLHQQRKMFFILYCEYGNVPVTFNITDYYEWHELLWKFFFFHHCVFWLAVVISSRWPPHMSVNKHTLHCILYNEQGSDMSTDRSRTVLNVRLIQWDTITRTHTHTHTPLCR